MICAGDRYPGCAPPSKCVDSCQGDSGGPLYASVGHVGSSNTAFIQVGIVSWGYSCADGWPGVYARVSDVLDFIGNYRELGREPSGSFNYGYYYYGYYYAGGECAQQVQAVCESDDAWASYYGNYDFEAFCHPDAEHEYGDFVANCCVDQQGLCDSFESDINEESLWLNCTSDCPLGRVCASEGVAAPCADDCGGKSAM